MTPQQNPLQGTMPGRHPAASHGTVRHVTGRPSQTSRANVQHGGGVVTKGCPSSSSPHTHEGREGTSGETMDYSLSESSFPLLPPPPSSFIGTSVSIFPSGEFEEIGSLDGVPCKPHRHINTQMHNYQSPQKLPAL